MVTEEAAYRSLASAMILDAVRGARSRNQKRAQTCMDYLLSDDCKHLVSLLGRKWNVKSEVDVLDAAAHINGKVARHSGSKERKIGKAQSDSGGNL